MNECRFKTQNIAKLKEPILYFILLIFSISCDHHKEKIKSYDFGRSIDAIGRSQIESEYKNAHIPFFNTLRLTHFKTPLDSLSLVMIYPKMKVQKVVYIKLDTSSHHLTEFEVKYQLDKEGYFQLDGIETRPTEIKNKLTIRNLVIEIDSLVHNGQKPNDAGGTNMCSVFIEFLIRGDHYYFQFSDFDNSKKSLFNEKVLRLLDLIASNLNTDPIAECE